MDLSQELKWLVGRGRVRREGGSVVVRPASVREVARVVKVAARRRTPVGTAWNAPVRLDLSDMNRVLEWDIEGCGIKVEAGAPCTRLFEFLYERGFVAAIPVAPVPVGEWAEAGTPGFGSLGLGGPAAAVRALQAVTLDGEVVETSPCRVGPGPYDLRGLFLSGGRSLGIVTAVTLQLRPRGSVGSLLYTFADGAASGKAIAALSRSAAVSPLHVGFDTRTLHVVLSTDPDLLPLEEAEVDRLVAEAAGSAPEKAAGSLADAGLLRPLSHSGLQWEKIPLHPLQTPVRGRLVPVSEIASGPPGPGLLADRGRAFLADGEAAPREGFQRMVRLTKEHLDPGRIYGAY